MPRLIGIFAVLFLLISCQQKENSANQMKQMEKPDSPKESGSSVSNEEKIKELTQSLSNLPQDSIDSHHLSKQMVVPFAAALEHEGVAKSLEECAS